MGCRTLKVERNDKRDIDMKTVKAKIKGTNAILEGCVCDDSFFVSVDHDTFERYDLDEVELCESNPNSLTLEEAAKDYTDSSEWLIGENLEHIEASFIAGAKWQIKKFQEFLWMLMRPKGGWGEDKDNNEANDN